MFWMFGSDEDSRPVEVAAMTDRWLAGRGRTLQLWEDGEVVSMAGIGSPTPHGLRIGPVYTPPVHRRRGYASALVADVTPQGIHDLFGLVRTETENNPAFN